MGELTVQTIRRPGTLFRKLNPSQLEQQTALVSSFS